MLSRMRDYQILNTNDIRIIVKRAQDGIESQLLVIQNPFGYRRAAELFRPEGESDGSLAALYGTDFYNLAENFEWVRAQGTTGINSRQQQRAIEYAFSAAGPWQ